MAREKAIRPKTGSKLLRERAEHLLRARSSDTPTMPTADVQALVHELNVRHMELEIQNEALRQAQLELARSHDRYANLYEFAPVGYVTLNKDGKIVEANLTAATLLGVERGALVGASFSTWIDRHAQDNFHLHRQAVFSSDRKQICELDVHMSDGTPLVVRLESIAFAADQERCRTSLIDVTQRSKAEEALQKLNETLEERVAERTREVKLLAEAMANLGEGVLITSDHLDWPGPRILYVNKAMCRITGYTAEELIGKTPRMLQGPTTDRETINRLRHALSKKHSHLCEVVNYRKDGAPYDAELFVSPLFDAQGKHTTFIAIHRDITERKRNEQLLREREERMRTILNAAADAIITIDPRGIIDAVNSATERMFGYSEEELIGQNVKILMPPPYRDEHDGYLARYQATGEARIIGIGREVVGRRKDGSTIPLDLAVSEVDHLGLFTGIIRDISDRRELQKQVLEIAADEDRRIGHELHDNIQQQLTGLGLLAQTLAEGFAQESSEQARMAARLAKGIRESASDVHLLSRGLVPVEIDAEGLRSALTDLAARVGEQYGVHCDFQDSGSVGMLDNFTATHLYRIAQEAVNNSVKHSGAERIEISLNGVDDSVTLNVLDDGKSIGNQRISSPGMGLRIMDYRARLIGATVQVAPGEDGGTLVSCTVLRGG